MIKKIYVISKGETFVFENKIYVVMKDIKCIWYKEDNVTFIECDELKSLGFGDTFLKAKEDFFVNLGFIFKEYVINNNKDILDYGAKELKKNICKYLRC